jgi:uncharacterized membrane protein YqjE
MTPDGVGKARAMVQSEGAPTRNGRRSAPVADLVRALLSDVSLLVRKEAELATIELKAKASEVGGAAALLGAGAVVALLAAGTLIAAAVLALAIVLPAWAAALIVGVVLLALAAVLAVLGRSRLRAATPLAPTDTIDTVREDIAWMRHEAERLNETE